MRGLPGLVGEVDQVPLPARTGGIPRPRPDSGCRRWSRPGHRPLITAPRPLRARDLKHGNAERAAVELASLRNRLDLLYQDGARTGTGYAAVLGPEANLPTRGDNSGRD
jgi:hypothetical protein